MDNEDILNESVVREVARELRVRTMQSLISGFVVCMTLGLFGHVGDSTQVPRCFLRRSILSRTLDTIAGQGVLCVKGFGYLIFLFTVYLLRGQIYEIQSMFSSFSIGQ